MEIFTSHFKKSRIIKVRKKIHLLLYILHINVIVKNNCGDCDTLETHLFNLREEFQQNIGARVVKAHNSQLVRLYSPTKEPAVVFFRHGVPLLYDGPLVEDEIFTRIDTNRVPVVRELADENFEHLTQASTGATTGDWFILLYVINFRKCIYLYNL